jgi:hypothetical protein
MLSDTTPHRHSAATPDADRATPEQLTLLPSDRVTPRFRLSRETRERGLRHVAEIRRMLAERAEVNAAAPGRRAA